MKYIGMPVGMWALFGKSFERNLITGFGLDRDAAKAVAAKAKPRYKEIIAGLVVARTILFDQAVKKLLEKYPDAVCVNIGCGVDDRFLRVDNGRIKWFNVLRN